MSTTSLMIRHPSVDAQGFEAFYGLFVYLLSQRGRKQKKETAL